LSPSWKLFVAQHDAHTSKVDIGRLLTVSSCLLSSAFSRVKSRRPQVLEHGETDSSVLRSMTQLYTAGLQTECTTQNKTQFIWTYLNSHPLEDLSHSAAATSANAGAALRVQPARSLPDATALPNTICCIIRWCLLALTRGSALL
jgi:hypothetical protein